MIAFTMSRRRTQLDSRNLTSKANCNAEITNQSIYPSTQSADIRYVYSGLNNEGKRYDIEGADETKAS